MLKCSFVGFPYAGLRDGSYCVCGHEYKSSVVTDDTDCQTACTGKPHEKCGGEGFLEIYHTGYMGK